MKAVRSVSRFICVQVEVQLFLHHLLERLSWPHCVAFVPFVKSVTV